MYRLFLWVNAKSPNTQCRYRNEFHEGKDQKQNPHSDTKVQQKSRVKLPIMRRMGPAHHKEIGVDYKVNLYLSINFTKSYAIIRVIQMLQRENYVKC